MPSLESINVEHGDRFTVEPKRVFGEVYVTLSESRSREVDAFVKPQDARRLARALNRAANVAEGKPAKKPKPAEIIDGEGDTWYLHTNGKYSLRQRPNPDDAVMTRRKIREEYGIKVEG